MGPFELAAIAIIAVCTLSAYKAYRRGAGKVGRKELEQMQAELDRLRTRVATLESIVTDRSWDLKDEISKL